MPKRLRSADQVWGFIEYELIGDGSLNGKWTNNFFTAGQICNEIARKVNGPRNAIPGIYHTAWLEENAEQAIIALLKIKAVQSWLTLQWEVDGDIAFSGTARLIGPNRLTAIYWDGPILTLPFRP